MRMLKEKPPAGGLGISELLGQLEPSILGSSLIKLITQPLPCSHQC